MFRKISGHVDFKRYLSQVRSKWHEQRIKLEGKGSIAVDEEI